MSVLLVLLALVVLAGCGSAPEPARPVSWLREEPLPFTHVSGAKGEFLMPEIMGSGVGLLDYDGDGDLDVCLVQGHPTGGSNQLLRNDGGRFVDVTAAAGLSAENYGMGVATSDFDRDGDVDLLVTAFGGNRLYRNDGGKFVDVTAGSPAVALPKLWSSGASFFDYDNDGWQDLVILNYVDYQFAANKRCQAPTGEPDYCTPRAYRSLPSHLFHNEHGRFVDVTAKSGIDRAAGPGLGVVAFDADQDGWLDLFVANDSSANHLWMNQKNGTFAEKALEHGLAYGENGLAKAGMGVALGDYDNDGDEDLLVLNLMREGATLFSNLGNGDFADVSARTGIHSLTYLFTGFGVGWFDVDSDGRLDLFLANGAVTRREGQPARPFDEGNLLLRQESGGRFEALAAPATLGVHRGAAFGDIDNDGDVDVVINVNGGGARLLRNVAAHGNWLGVSAPVGSRVSLGEQVRFVRTDGSYLSASDARVFFAVSGKVGALTVEARGKPPRVYSEVGMNRVFVVPVD